MVGGLGRGVWGLLTLDHASHAELRTVLWGPSHWVSASVHLGCCDKLS